MGEFFRERESEQVRNENFHAWTKVSRRKSRPKQIASQTIFISNLPLHFTSKDIESLLQDFKPILNIHITQNVKDGWRYKYAFAKLENTVVLLNAIQKLNGRKIENNLILLQPAKYDKRTPPPPPKPLPFPAQKTPYPRKTPQKPSCISLSKRDHRSYREAALNYPNPNLIPIPNPQQIPNYSSPKQPLETLSPKPKLTSPKTASLSSMNEQDPQPDFFFFNPSKQRRMSSRALGTDTEKIRDELIATELDDDCFAVIKGEYSKENEDLFNRSIIAMASSSTPSNSLMDGILAAGVNCLTIRPLGGMMHLITFSSMEDKQAMIESGWLESWFDNMSDVKETFTPLWRETWIKIYGVPLSAWNYQNFYNIGCIYGRVISVDHSSFEYANVLVFTDCLFKINSKLALQIEESTYKIFTFEDGPSKKITSPPINSIHGTPSFAGDSPEKTSPENQTDPSTHSMNTTPCNSRGFNNYYLSSPPKINAPASPNTLLNDVTATFSPSRMAGENTSVPKSWPPSDNSHHGPNPSTATHNHPASPAKLKVPDKPIPLANSFDPLQRPKTTSSSSNSSGPLFPPGFEDHIPVELKAAHENQKLRKKSI